MVLKYILFLIKEKWRLIVEFFIFFIFKSVLDVMLLNICFLEYIEGLV